MVAIICCTIIIILLQMANSGSVDQGSAVLEGNELMVVLESMKEEDIIKNASLGQPLLLIIDQLLKCNLKKLSKYFSDQIESVLSRSLGISTSKKYMSSVWRNFHCLRLSAEMKVQWTTHFNELKLSEELPLAKLSDMLLQIILNRMMHRIINQLWSNECTSSSVEVSISPLTMRE